MSEKMSEKYRQPIVAKHVALAAGTSPTLAEKRVTPHVLRHTCAMHIFQATRDVRHVSL